MTPKCANKACILSKESPKKGLIIRKGFYRRTSDCKVIQRWKCNHCGRNFSWASFNPCFGQKKRRLNHIINKLLCSGVSMRRCARLLHTTRVTVARKLKFLAEQVLDGHEGFIKNLAPIRYVQFDEVETFEHTKLKPLSIAFVVSEKRKVLSFGVAKMPAKGLLAKRSVKKYGFRIDERPNVIRSVLKGLKGVVSEDGYFCSDENPSYSNILKEVFPHSNHFRVKGGRGCVTGQGELKKLRYDPLFSLNHTAAMFRANINRLFRRTWCTTKLPIALFYHLAIYVNYHNTVLTS